MLSNTPKVTAEKWPHHRILDRSAPKPMLLPSLNFSRPQFPHLQGGVIPARRQVGDADFQGPIIPWDCVLGSEKLPVGKVSISCHSLAGLHPSSWLANLSLLS